MNTDVIIALAIPASLVLYVIYSYLTHKDRY